MAIGIATRADKTNFNFFHIYLSVRKFKAAGYHIMHNQDDYATLHNQDDYATLHNQDDYATLHNQDDYATLHNQDDYATYRSYRLLL